MSVHFDPESSYLTLIIAWAHISKFETRCSCTVIMQFFLNNERKKKQIPVKYFNLPEYLQQRSISSLVVFYFYSFNSVFFCSFRISMRPDIHVQSFSLKFIWKDIILKSIVRLLSSCNLYRHTGAQNAKNYYIKICAVCNLTRYIWSDEMQDMGNSTKMKKVKTFFIFFFHKKQQTKPAETDRCSSLKLECQSTATKFRWPELECVYALLFTLNKNTCKSNATKCNRRKIHESQQQLQKCLHQPKSPQMECMRNRSVFAQRILIKSYYYDFSFCKIRRVAENLVNC